MWLRAVRAAERGQDPGIGIAGKSPPNPMLALDRALLVSPRRKPGPSYPQSPRRSPGPQGYPLRAPPWRSTAKAAHPPGPCSPLEQ